ncbi:MAG: DNA alkylation repair protein [Acidimicrobiales bacterium]|nr:DNA alkylation repair protein [Acidimicrobiales bacterium]
MGTWAEDVVERSDAALRRVADPSRAPQMQAYMKDVAPFLGVAAGPRRIALRHAWEGLADPTSDELGDASLGLMALPERELHHAACDLIDHYRRRADDQFCDRYVEELLTTKPWWDTVDGLVHAAVSPLCRRYPLDPLVDRWSGSGDRWLIRAAIGHQRGWKQDTDVARVLALCGEHWSDREFFVAKAIGWALRDLCRIDPEAVRAFLADHPIRNAVAEREAWRGLQRAGG